MSKSSFKLPSSLYLRIGLVLFFVLLSSFVLPGTQRHLPLRSRPVYAASHLLHAASWVSPSARDFWHTDGNRILDVRNRPVRISGMNWSGLETKEAVPGGLEKQDYRAILRTVKASGFNVVRIPFSNEMLEDPIVPDHIAFAGENGPMNTDLRDLTSVQILDKIIAYAGKIGLKVILDNHRSEAGSSAEESGLWYTPQFPESAWIADWTALAHRYANNSTVIGMDLRNEPHNADKGGSCWDCGGPNDWHRAAARAGNAILAVNPRVLIFVEGTDSYDGDTYWWGGNLEGVRRSPVRLSIPNRLVYSAHEYGPTEYAQLWFNASTTPGTLAAIWRRHWAFVSEAGIAPVWIGEFGTTNNDVDIQSSIPGSEGQWFTSLIAFFGSHPAVGWTYWGVNGEDRYGLLDAAYSNQPANPLKSEALASVRETSSEVRVAGAAPASLPLAAEIQVNEPMVFHQPAVVPVSLESASETPATPVEFAEGDAGSATAAHPHSHLAVTQAHRKSSSSEESVERAIALSVQRAVSAASQGAEGPEALAQ